MEYQEEIFAGTKSVMDSFSFEVAHKEDAHAFFGMDIWTSYIEVTGTGAWVVVCEFPSDLAARVTEGIFCLSADEISGDLIIDALGEVSNMLAGNIKGLLDPVAQLSVPAVEENVESVDIFPEANCLTEVNCQLEELVFKVKLLQKA